MARIPGTAVTQRSPMTQAQRELENSYDWRTLEEPKYVPNEAAYVVNIKTPYASSRGGGIGVDESQLADIKAWARTQAIKKIFDFYDKKCVFLSGGNPEPHDSWRQRYPGLGEGIHESWRNYLIESNPPASGERSVDGFTWNSRELAGILGITFEEITIEDYYNEPSFGDPTDWFISSRPGSTIQVKVLFAADYVDAIPQNIEGYTGSGGLSRNAKKSLIAKMATYPLFGTPEETRRGRTIIDPGSARARDYSDVRRNVGTLDAALSGDETAKDTIRKSAQRGFEQSRTKREFDYYNRKFKLKGPYRQDQDPFSAPDNQSFTSAIASARDQGALVGAKVLARELAVNEGKNYLKSSMKQGANAAYDKSARKAAVAAAKSNNKKGEDLANIDSPVVTRRYETRNFLEKIEFVAKSLEEFDKDVKKFRESGGEIYFSFLAPFEGEAEEIKRQQKEAQEKIYSDKRKGVYGTGPERHDKAARAVEKSDEEVIARIHSQSMQKLNLKREANSLRQIANSLAGFLSDNTEVYKKDHKERWKAGSGIPMSPFNQGFAGQGPFLDINFHILNKQTEPLIDIDFPTGTALTAAMDYHGPGRHKKFPTADAIDEELSQYIEEVGISGRLASVTYIDKGFVEYPCLYNVGAFMKSGGFTNPVSVGYLFQLDTMYDELMALNSCREIGAGIPSFPFIFRFTYPGLQIKPAKPTAKAKFKLGSSVKTEAEGIKEDAIYSSKMAKRDAGGALKGASNYVAQKLPYGNICTLKELHQKFLKKFSLSKILCDLYACFQLPGIPDISLWQPKFSMPKFKKSKTGWPKINLKDALKEMIVRFLCGLITELINAVNSPDCDAWKEFAGDLIGGIIEDIKAELNQALENIVPGLGQAAFGLPELEREDACPDLGGVTPTPNRLGTQNQQLLSASSVSDLVEKLSHALRPSEFCSLLAGEPDEMTLQVVNVMIDSRYPALRTIFTTNDIIMSVFSALGSTIIGQDLCQLMLGAVSGPSGPDALCDVDAFRQRVLANRVSKDELDEQVEADKRRRNRLYNKLKRLADSQNILSGVVPDNIVGGTPDSDNPALVPLYVPGSRVDAAADIAIRTVFNAITAPYDVEVKSFKNRMRGPALGQASAGSAPSEPPIDALRFRALMDNPDSVFYNPTGIQPDWYTGQNLMDDTELLSRMFEAWQNYNKTLNPDPQGETEAVFAEKLIMLLRDFKSIERVQTEDRVAKFKLLVEPDESPDDDMGVEIEYSHKPSTFCITDTYNLKDTYSVSISGEGMQHEISFDGSSEVDIEGEAIREQISDYDIKEFRREDGLPIQQQIYAFFAADIWSEYFGHGFKFNNHNSGYGSPFFSYMASNQFYTVIESILQTIAKRIAESDLITKDEFGRYGLENIDLNPVFDSDGCRLDGLISINSAIQSVKQHFYGLMGQEDQDYDPGPLPLSMASKGVTSILVRLMIVQVVLEGIVSFKEFGINTLYEDEMLVHYMMKRFDTMLQNFDSPADYTGNGDYSNFFKMFQLLLIFSEREQVTTDEVSNLSAALVTLSAPSTTMDEEEFEARHPDLFSEIEYQAALKKSIISNSMLVADSVRTIIGAATRDIFLAYANNLDVMDVAASRHKIDGWEDIYGTADTGGRLGHSSLAELEYNDELRHEDGFRRHIEQVIGPFPYNPEEKNRFYNPDGTLKAGMESFTDGGFVLEKFIKIQEVNWNDEVFRGYSNGVLNARDEQRVLVRHPEITEAPAGNLIPVESFKEWVFEMVGRPPTQRGDEDWFGAYFDCSNTFYGTATACEERLSDEDGYGPNDVGYDETKDLYGLTPAYLPNGHHDFGDDGNGHYHEKTDQNGGSDSNILFTTGKLPIHTGDTWGPDNGISIRGYATPQGRSATDTGPNAIDKQIERYLLDPASSQNPWVPLRFEKIRFMYTEDQRTSDKNPFLRTKLDTFRRRSPSLSPSRYIEDFTNDGLLGMSTTETDNSIEPKHNDTCGTKYVIYFVDANALFADFPRDSWRRNPATGRYELIDQASAATLPKSLQSLNPIAPPKSLMANKLQGAMDYENYTDKNKVRLTVVDKETWTSLHKIWAGTTSQKLSSGATVEDLITRSRNVQVSRDDVASIAAIKEREVFWETTYKTCLYSTPEEEHLHKGIAKSIGQDVTGKSTVDEKGNMTGNRFSISGRQITVRAVPPEKGGSYAEQQAYTYVSRGRYLGKAPERTETFGEAAENWWDEYGDYVTAVGAGIAIGALAAATGGAGLGALAAGVGGAGGAGGGALAGAAAVAGAGAVAGAAVGAAGGAVAAGVMAIEDALETEAGITSTVNTLRSDAIARRQEGFLKEEKNATSVFQGNGIQMGDLVTVWADVDWRDYLSTQDSGRSRFGWFTDNCYRYGFDRQIEANDPTIEGPWSRRNDTSLPYWYDRAGGWFFTCGTAVNYAVEPYWTSDPGARHPADFQSNSDSPLNVATNMSADLPNNLALRDYLESNKAIERHMGLDFESGLSVDGNAHHTMFKNWPVYSTGRPGYQYVGWLSSDIRVNGNTTITNPEDPILTTEMETTPAEDSVTTLSSIISGKSTYIHSSGKSIRDNNLSAGFINLNESLLTAADYNNWADVVRQGGDPTLVHTLEQSKIALENELAALPAITLRANSPELLERREIEQRINDQIAFIESVLDPIGSFGDIGAYEFLSAIHGRTKWYGSMPVRLSERSEFLALGIDANGVYLDQNNDSSKFNPDEERLSFASTRGMYTKREANPYFWMPSSMFFLGGLGNQGYRVENTSEFGAEWQAGGGARDQPSNAEAENPALCREYYIPSPFGIHPNLGYDTRGTGGVRSGDPVSWNRLGYKDKMSLHDIYQSDFPGSDASLHNAGFTYARDSKAPAYYCEPGHTLGMDFPGEKDPDELGQNVIRDLMTYGIYNDDSNFDDIINSIANGTGEISYRDWWFTSGRFAHEHDTQDYPLPRITREEGESDDEFERRKTSEQTAWRSARNADIKKWFSSGGRNKRNAKSHSNINRGNSSQDTLDITDHHLLRAFSYVRTVGAKRYLFQLEILYRATSTNTTRTGDRIYLSPTNLRSYQADRSKILGRDYFYEPSGHNKRRHSDSPNQARYNTNYYRLFSTTQGRDHNSDYNYKVESVLRAYDLSAIMSEHGTYRETAGMPTGFPDLPPDELERIELALETLAQDYLTDLKENKPISVPYEAPGGKTKYMIRDAKSYLRDGEGWAYDPSQFALKKWWTNRRKARGDKIEAASVDTWYDIALRINLPGKTYVMKRVFLANNTAKINTTDVYNVDLMTGIDLPGDIDEILESTELNFAITPEKRLRLKAHEIENCYNFVRGIRQPASFINWIESYREWAEDGQAILEELNGQLNKCNMEFGMRLTYVNALDDEFSNSEVSETNERFHNVEFPTEAPDVVEEPESPFSSIPSTSTIQRTRMPPRTSPDPEALLTELDPNIEPVGFGRGRDDRVYSQKKFRTTENFYAPPNTRDEEMLRHKYIYSMPIIEKTVPFKLSNILTIERQDFSEVAMDALRAADNAAIPLTGEVRDQLNEMANTADDPSSAAGSYGNEAIYDAPQPIGAPERESGHSPEDPTFINVVQYTEGLSPEEFLAGQFATIDTGNLDVQGYLKNKIISSDEFNIFFKYLFPIKRFSSVMAIYNVHATSANYDLDKMFDRTRGLTMLIAKNMMVSDWRGIQVDANPIPEGFDMSQYSISPDDPSLGEIITDSLIRMTRGLAYMTSPGYRAMYKPLNDCNLTSGLTWGSFQGRPERRTGRNDFRPWDMYPPIPLLAGQHGLYEWPNAPFMGAYLNPLVTVALSLPHLEGESSDAVCNQYRFEPRRQVNCLEKGIRNPLEIKKND